MRASLCGPRVATGILPRLRAGDAGSWALPDSSLPDDLSVPARYAGVPDTDLAAGRRKHQNKAFTKVGSCRTTRVLVGQVDSCSSGLLFP